MYKNITLNKLQFKINSLIQTISHSSVNNVSYYHESKDFLDLLRYKHTVDHYWDYLYNTLSLCNDSLLPSNKPQIEQAFNDCDELRLKINNFILCYLNLL